jgi:hypothetical protein
MSSHFNDGLLNQHLFAISFVISLIGGLRGCLNFALIVWHPFHVLLSGHVFSIQTLDCLNVIKTLSSHLLGGFLDLLDARTEIAQTSFSL